MEISSAFKFLPVLGEYLSLAIKRSLPSNLASKWKFRTEFKNRNDVFEGDGSRAGPARQELDSIERAKLWILPDIDNEWSVRCSVPPLWESERIRWDPCRFPGTQSRASSAGPYRPLAKDEWLWLIRGQVKASQPKFTIFLKNSLAVILYVPNSFIIHL